MSPAANILLAMMREANMRNFFFVDEEVQVIARVLGVTPEEMATIGEILKADLRELNTSYGGFGTVNEILERITPENPYGF